MRLGKRNSYRLLSFVIFIFLALSTKYGWLDKPAQLAKQNQPGYYAVTSPIDGDTVEVDMNGHKEIVRFIGVDTPETHRPNTPVQCYGPEAANFTKNLLQNAQVRLESDPQDTNRDRYGRLLRYVYLPDGTLAQDKLLTEGYAFAYTQFPFEKKESFIAQEQTAKINKKGLWNICQIIVQPNGRQQTGEQLVNRPAV